MPTRTTRGKPRRTRPNRQQLRAAEIRAAQTHEDVFAKGSSISDQEESADGNELQRAQQKGRASGHRVVRVRKLTRDEEYSFIRADLRRLLITAGSLGAIMIALLFVIDR